MISSFGVVFNLGEIRFTPKPLVLMMSSLGVILNLGEIRFAGKSPSVDDVLTWSNF